MGIYAAFGQNTVIQLKTEGKAIYGIVNNKEQQTRFEIQTNIAETGASEVKISQPDKNTIERFRTIEHYQDKCQVREKITTTDYGLHWQVEITGNANLWSAPIDAAIEWEKPAGINFWTTWADNQTVENPTEWLDPFVSAPLANLNLKYGGNYFDRNAFVIPIATSFLPGNAIAVSFTESPADTIPEMYLTTTKTGEIAYKHINQRIGVERTIRFNFDLVVHESDWRAGLGWMRNRYKEFFEPVNPLVNKVAGCASYSSYEGKLDIAKYRKMAYSVNWKASLDFPFMGMFIPPVVSDTETWVKYKQFGVTVGDGLGSVQRLRDYSDNFSKSGFYTLSYFNITEAGNNIKYPIPARKAKDDKDLWKDANDFIYYQMRSGLLHAAEILPDWDERPIYSNWENSVAMDPGDETYQKFFLDQAQRHIDKIPATSGICIDRLDWLSFYNGKADDKVSLYNGKKVRSLVMSWYSAMDKLGPLMHKANKVIFCNPLYKRIDLFKHIDGFYDEYGNYPASLSLSAQLALNKPLMSWTTGKTDFLPNPDSYFQHHLYLGAFLTAPFPGNDHTILPDEDTEKLYLEYGFLLNMLRDKEWVLEPNIIKVNDQNALANIFKTGEGYVVPVVLAKEKEGIVKVTIKKTSEMASWKTVKANFIQPGQQKFTKLKVKFQKEYCILEVPVHKGCAMLMLSK